MPGGLGRTDRQLIGGALLIAFLMAAGTVAFAPGSKETGPELPSSYSAGPGGAKAAYLVLEQLHYPVQRWLQSPTHLASVDSHAVLILAEPTDSPIRPEREALLRFIRDGGRVLFCGPTLGLFFPNGNSKFAIQTDQDFSPDLPSAYTKGAWRIHMNAVVAWKEIRPNQVGLYGGDNPVIIAWKIGNGELLWWASATPLTNEGLKQQDNLVLFLNAVSGASDHVPRPIYWDEYFHYGQGSLWSYIAKTPVKWGLLQAVLLLMAVLFAYSRRSGPVLPPRTESRLSPLEFVNAVAGLYRRASATQVVAEVGYRHLRLALTRKLAVPSDISDDALAEAASQRLGWVYGEFSTTLSQAAEAQKKKREPRQFLAVAQDLARYADRLHVGRRAHSENI